MQQYGQMTYGNNVAKDGTLARTLQNATLLGGRGMDVMGEVASLGLVSLQTHSSTRFPVFLPI